MQYVPVYRKLLANALRATWHHRRLWCFGFLAALAQTGAVANDLLRLAPKLEPGSFSWKTLEGTWHGATLFQTFFAGLLTGTTLQISLSLLMVGAVAIIGVLLILTGQHMLLQGVHRTTRRKKHLTPRELRKAVGLEHLARLFSIDVLAKLITISLILLGGLCIRALLAHVPHIGTLAVIAVYAVMLPLTFAVNAISMHILVHMVRDNTHLAKALQDGVTFFARHTLATLEFTAMLFIVNYVATLGFIAALWVLGQILVAIFATSLSSVVFLMAAFIVTACSVLVVIVAIGGCVTTLNYSAWTEFVEHFIRVPSQHPRTEHVVRLVRHAFSR